MMYIIARPDPDCARAIAPAIAPDCGPRLRDDPDCVNVISNLVPFFAVAVVGCRGNNGLQGQATWMNTP